MDNNFYRYIKESDLNEYEKTNKCLSYANLFYNDDALILCNNIGKNWEELELVNGTDFDEIGGYYDDIYQYYIIDDSTAKRLIDNTNEIIYYHNELDIYVLGVTHYGTNWHYVYSGFDLIEDEDKGYYKAIKHDYNEETEDNEENEI